MSVKIKIGEDFTRPGLFNSDQSCFDTAKPEPVFHSFGQLLENIAIQYGAALLGIKDTANIFITYRSVWLDITHPGSIRGNRFEYFFVDSGRNAFMFTNICFPLLSLSQLQPVEVGNLGPDNNSAKCAFFLTSARRHHVPRNAKSEKLKPPRSQLKNK